MVLLDQQPIITVGRDNPLAEVPLTEEGVSGEDPAAPVEVGEEPRSHGQFRLRLVPGFDNGQFASTIPRLWQQALSAWTGYSGEAAEASRPR